MRAVFILTYPIDKVILVVIYGFYKKKSESLLAALVTTMYELIVRKVF